MASQPWSNIEVELIVADYLKMLRAELKRESYIKVEHRRNLLPLLNQRSHGSIEFKHQNISAILIELGQPYIKGYLPRFNYQYILKDIVIGHLSGDINLNKEFEMFSEKAKMFSLTGSLDTICNPIPVSFKGSF